MSPPVKAPDTVMLRWALIYAARGWKVLPLHWRKAPELCSCGCKDPECHSRAKHPLLKGSFSEASTDPKQINEWWKRWPRANIGIATGRVSGLDVLDVDPRNGGRESLKELVAEFGELPPVPLALSGGGGPHYYFSHGQRSFPKSVGDGLDVVSDKRSIVAPYSEHITGQRYRWVVQPKW